jgi:hypothetical protein
MTADLIERARIYATSAHPRINHGPKFVAQPYQAHLEAVARIVRKHDASDTTLAAAWLHDALEDTPATLNELRAEFGAEVAQLLHELLIVSLPSQGSRAERLQIDCAHLARASAPAKLIKLADLIEDCQHVKKLPDAAQRQFLDDMAAYLQALSGGAPALHDQATRLHRAAAESQLQQALAAETRNAFETPDAPPASSVTALAGTRLRRVFAELFTVSDVAEPLPWFEENTAADEVEQALLATGCAVAGVRAADSRHGYVLRHALAACGNAPCMTQRSDWHADQIIDSDAPLVDALTVLTRREVCFVAHGPQVHSYVMRDAINKPVARMWLFGIISLLELSLSQLLDWHFSGDSWHSLISASRLKRAQDLQAERQRRNQPCLLSDCLQLSDKAQIVFLNHAPTLEALGFESKRVAKQVIKDLESLRNNLAHAQDIATHDWPQVARLCRRINELSAAP